VTFNVKDFFPAAERFGIAVVRPADISRQGVNMSKATLSPQASAFD